MNRQQLAHLLRSACAIADDAHVLVLGSQSILGSFEEDDLPPEATASQEADIAFLNDPDRRKADGVEGALGELSAFHDMNGIYAQPADPRFLEPHDLAVAKLAAGRPKDRDFVSALLQRGLLDVTVIRARAATLSDGADPRVGARIVA